MYNLKEYHILRFTVSILNHGEKGNDIMFNFIYLKKKISMLLKTSENFYSFSKNYSLFHFVFQNYFKKTMTKQC